MAETDECWTEIDLKGLEFSRGIEAGLLISYCNLCKYVREWNSSEGKPVPITNTKLSNQRFPHLDNILSKLGN